MTSLRNAGVVCSAAFLVWLGVWSEPGSVLSASAKQEKSTQNEKTSDQSSPHALPRGKKLVLKDGSYQLVRDYQVLGERVRYISSERGDWEEIPASMIDWDATKKAEASEKADEDALAKKIHAQEQAQRTEPVMDVDASLQVAPGVFLPQGEGMFLIDGKSVKLLGQVGTQIKTDKKQFLKQVFTPIPIVPGKQNVEIPGVRASIRVTSGQVEFYLRDAPPDPDRVNPIVRSSRPGESGPDVELVRANVKGGSRQLESIKTMFGEDVDEKHTSVSMQRWEIAPLVYRFTLSAPLQPGEYALAEILSDGMNLFVWDFGVDTGAGTKQATASKSNK